MNTVEPTFADCPQDKIVGPYLAGELAEADANAYEEHYFACDRCWDAVQRGLELRAAFLHEARDDRSPRKSPVRVGLAVAASLFLVIMAGGLWQWQSSNRPAPDGVVERGRSDLLRLDVAATTEALSLRWDAVEGADSYAVRLLDVAGSVIFEDTTNATQLTVSRSSLPSGKQSVPLVWHVEALDSLRRTVASSGLVVAEPERAKDSR